MADIDLEILITLVHERPILWDKTEASYKDRIQTRNAWIEIFKELNNKFEELEDKAKNDYGKYVTKKWANLRDAFQRSERNYKSSVKSGSARQPPKTYVYAKQMLFLKKTFEGRPTDDSFSGNVEFHSSQLPQSPGSVYDETLQNPQDNDTYETFEEESTFKKPDQHSKKKRKPDSVELELINAIKQKPNRHTSFFNGIIPSLEIFDDDEIVEFQLKVLQFVSEIKKRKKSLASTTDSNFKQLEPIPTDRPTTSREIHIEQDHRYHVLQRGKLQSELSQQQPTFHQSHQVNPVDQNSFGFMAGRSITPDQSDFSDTSLESLNYY